MDDHSPAAEMLDTSLAARRRVIASIPSDLPTIVHHSRHFAAGDQADEPVFTHVRRRPGEHDRLSFSQLDRKARAIAAEIQAKGGAGKPVLIVLDPGNDYAAALYGCLYARAIAVPVYPPQMLRLQHTLSRLQAIVANAGAKLMLSSQAIIGDSPGPIWGLGNDAAIAVDQIDDQQASEWREDLPTADDVAILQYTSGSTGNPQGVVLRHQSVSSNLRALLHQFHFPDVRCVQWVPPYHDMGLVGGILVPVFVGCETVILSPIDFVRDPLLWLQCIDAYRGTSNGAPNFGYELCVRKIKDSDCEGLDLSSWKVAIAGAEPVRQSTLKRFCEKFEPYGFSPDAFCPAFGMAETTVIATGSQVGHPYQSIDVDIEQLQQGVIRTDTDANADTMTLVSSGDVVLGMEVEIVDPNTLRLAPSGTVGEIWVRGSSLADGYWGEPERTAESFNATILDGQHSDYLRTGDLGAMIDGQLYVTGRRKELIIVAGKNLYPHDVEEIVQTTSAAFKPGGGTAFGIETDDGEQLVVVHEITRPKRFDREEVLREAVAAIAQQIQVTPRAVVLVRAGSLPKTSSGKLRRRDVRQSFLDNELQEIARWENGAAKDAGEASTVPPSTETELQIAAVWKDLLGVEFVGRGDDFFYLGGSSLLVSQMITATNEQFQIDLPLQSVFHHPTLQSFSRLVDQSDQKQTTNGVTRSPIHDNQPHVLSAAQQRIWLLSRLEQTDAFLNVPVSIHLQGALDHSRLQNALNELVRRHPALRTSLIESGDGAMQVTAQGASIVLQSFGETDGLDLNQFNNEPFDLGHAPLMRAAITSQPSDNDRIDLVFHHIICDAGSVGILLADLERILAGEELPEPPTLRYVDFAAWDRGNDHVHRVNESLAYWRERLQDMPSVIELPCDPLVQNTTQKIPPAKALIADDLATRIGDAATKHGVTPSMLFLLAYQSMLARYSNANDFGILVPSSNRPAADLERVAGCYVNPIVYRANASADQSLAQAVASTRDQLLTDLEHADVPFQNVVDAIRHDRTAGRMPLAQTMFLYQPSLKTIHHLGSAEVAAVTPDYSAVTAYDLSLVVHPVDAGFDILLLHGENCDRRTTHRMLDSLLECIDQLANSLSCDAESTTLSQLLIPSEGEREFLQLASEGAIIDCHKESLLDRLHQHASNTAQAIAIEDDETAVHYGDLDSMSDAMAHQLVATGVRPGSLVGIRLPRSCEMVVAILGLWKAGAAYVPLSDDLPESRLSDMVRDARISMVIDQAMWTQLRSGDAIDATLPSPPAGNDLAYVIYTSGSTGKPKGVAIEHHSVANLLASFASEPGFTHEDSMLALTTLSFDISVLEIFLPLWCGARSRVTAHTVAANPEAVIETIRSSGVTHVQATPSTIRMLLSSGWKPSQELIVLSGGEPLMPDIAKGILAHGCQLWNVYGPTETTVWSAVTRVDDADDITIGRAIGNTLLVVLDDQFRQTPVGVPGELCIGGDGLARGYLDRESLTAEKFVTVGGERIYRTGDVARLRADGRLEFLARNDRQIKLRGFRIELDEIESILQTHCHVERAAVVLDTDTGPSPRLVAFCQCSDHATTDKELRGFAEQHLPSYMVPIVALVQEIPRSAAGKTNYAVLRIDSLAEPINVELDAPKTPLEITIAEEWCDVLNCHEVSRNDNFFHVGGNSLLAAQLFARLRERFNMDLPLREVYERPTIAALSELIFQRQSSQQPDDFSDLLNQIESLSDEEALDLLGQINDRSETDHD